MLQLDEIKRNDFAGVGDMGNRETKFPRKKAVQSRSGSRHELALRIWLAIWMGPVLDLVVGCCVQLYLFVVRSCSLTKFGIRMGDSAPPFR